MKKITFTTWEEFCDQTGRDPKALPNVSALEETDARRLLAGHKLAAMTLECNGGKIPSYEPGSPWKHEIAWKVIKDESQPSGLGLSYGDYDFWYTFTRCGPRFAFLEEDDMMHMATHFKPLYEDLHL